MLDKTPQRSKLGPIELEVIHGTIRAAELEIEAAVERTARSPMIRDQHDYRVALFDAKGRKLTGRSYSAIVEPVFQYFGDDINPGDVFFWNDPYNSCGGIGHVPDLCTTVPIFHGERLIGFSQVFGHHDDVGGSVPGSLPVHATDSWMEGLLVPPIKLYEAGRLNEAAFRIITRNSRLSEHLAGDMDAEIGAARLGSRRIVALADRYGVDALEAAFDQILHNTAEIFRREILPKIRDGVYHYEDYIEADGVDAPKLHALRLTMTKTPEKIVLDFNGTDPEAKGPINWALDEVEGRYFRKWLAPTLRSLAASPERAAEIDSNEGVLDVVEVVFPAKGTLITPNFGKPTGMRFFLMLRSLGVFAACLSKATGGKMPADHETIRIWGLTGGQNRDFYLFREVLGGGSPGRPWADGSDVVHVVPNSKNLPAEFSETRYPIMIEQLGLARDSGG
ncbi:MAG: hydantoinase B/oxoprolinase family protein, partial [Alphaproteobacteria bacterium]|nr:hydantoinase B/oxoprolinase family protein [Alphaproteobacteria bacterium]